MHARDVAAAVSFLAGDGTATGRTVTLPGNDVIAVEGGKIRSVEVSYDRQAADAQLGATTT